MSFGALSERDSSLILGVLQSFRELEKAVLFGSRAMGRAKSNSDIDIATWGLSELELGRLAVELDELPMPYMFDVIAYELTDNPELRSHIDRVGVPLYESGRSAPLR